MIGDNVVDSDGVSQEWFDEDFGLTRRKKEAEELHRQQLLIEQEVCALIPFHSSILNQFKTTCHSLVINLKYFRASSL